MAVSLLMALVTAGLVALLVVRRIAASVTDLADAADAIAAGDYARDRSRAAGSAPR